MKKSFFEKIQAKSVLFEKIQGEISHFFKKSAEKHVFCLENASKKESRESLTKVWRKYH
jgi:hypothetical protein